MKTTSTTMQLLFRMFSAKAHFNIVEKSVHTIDLKNTRRLVFKKNCFSAWASTLNMGLINKVDMVCLLPVGYGV